MDEGVAEAAVRVTAEVAVLGEVRQRLGELSLEAAGFAARGQGVHFGKDGEIALDGRLPISTMGGLKARGHPVGATGIYQLAETWLQLAGEAGANQVQGDPDVALVQNIGGTGATVVSHVLVREA